MREARISAARDGLLRAKVWRAEGDARFRAFLLIAPLLLLLLIGFVLPIGAMLLRSVDNEITPRTLPQTTAVLERWDAGASELPPDAAFEAMIADLRQASRKERTRLGVRLNYDMPGLSSLFRKTPRRLAPRNEAALARINLEIASKGARAVLVALDRKWAERRLWVLLKARTGAYTAGYYLAAVDREIGPEGETRLKPEDQRIYIALFQQTFAMSVAITALALLLGYPVAYLMAALPARRANLLMILVLLPFWTSLLARTSAWQVLLLDQGVINDFLLATGLNSALLAVLGIFGSPDVESLCRNDLRQILAGGEVVAQMASRVGLQELSTCALEVIDVLKAQGPEAAMRRAAELQSAGDAWGYGDERFTMTNNRTGVVIAMTHILLPFAILPLHAVMKTIPADHVRAAKSLGASNWTAFWRVYFPASLPGVTAGGVLVFILAVGYYITPEILGGAEGRFVSNQIAFHISESLNWGLAAALGTLLLLLVLALYLLFERLAGAQTVRLR